SLPHKIVVREEDFKAAISIIGTLLRHNTYIFNRLPNKKEVEEKPNPKVLLLKRLPESFSTADFLKLASQLSYSRSSGFRIKKEFLNEGLIVRRGHGNYGIAENRDM